MRELILKMSMTLDGFVGDLEGTNAWLRGSDKESLAWLVETLWNSSLHVMGSRTFATMAGFYPSSTLPFAPPMNEIPKAVFSKQEDAALTQASAGNWADAYVASGDLADEVSKLKAQDGKPIIAHGGATFARSLIVRGLVDRYMLTVHPVALGKGQPLFSELTAAQPLTFEGVKTFPAGAVVLTYRPA